MWERQFPKAKNPPVKWEYDGQCIFLRDASGNLVYALEPATGIFSGPGRPAPKDHVLRLEMDTFLYEFGNGTFTAKNLKTGKILWTTKLPKLSGLLEIKLKDGILRVSNRDGGLMYIINPRTGTILSKHLIRR